MATPRLNSGTSVAVVQAAMNAANGTVDYWARGKANWLNLIIARNNFIRQELEALDINITTYNSLEKYKKNVLNETLHTRFREAFFAYSRREEWMRKAISDNASWIQIEGIEVYMVRSAVMAIINKPEKDLVQGTGSQLQGSVADNVNRSFDPIRSI